MNLGTFSLKGKRNASVQKSTKSPSDQFSIDSFYYNEISLLTRAGGWGIDFKNKKSFFDDQTRNILKVPSDYIPSLNIAHKFYAEEHKEKATTLFLECAKGKPFSTQIKMQTYIGEVFWAKAAGSPLKDEEGQIIGIRGIFQNIHKEKLYEEELDQSNRLLQGHNARLFDFAHIISHDLRFHVGNLQMSAALFETSNLNSDQKELFNNFKEIGDSLEATLKHLNKIVSVRSEATKARKSIKIQDVYNGVVSKLAHIIIDKKAVIYTDFSEVEEILYNEKYLENTLRNLITNAIRYKHPDRTPEISLYSYEEDGKTLLLVRDNGVGIDLERHGQEIFKLYKTFNGNTDALGIGLFLTRNEVMAMGGDISVESEVGKGSKFTVTL